MSAISGKLIHRLTLYHCILNYTVSEHEFVSSNEIANLLKIDDSQVRKDIAVCGIQGVPKHGYKVLDLKKSIEKKLSFNKQTNIFVIGAGHLATALTQYSDFKDYGINILALFDNDKAKIGSRINGKPVFDMMSIKEKINEMKIDTVILAVPPNVAQKITDDLIRLSIKFIWNFTPCIIKVPDSVIVYYENIVSGFLRLKL